MASGQSCMSGTGETRVAVGWLAGSCVDYGGLGVPVQRAPAPAQTANGAGVPHIDQNAIREEKRERTGRRSVPSRRSTTSCAPPCPLIHSTKP